MAGMAQGGQGLSGAGQQGQLGQQGGGAVGIAQQGGIMGQNAGAPGGGMAAAQQAFGQLTPEQQEAMRKKRVAATV